MPSKLQLCSLAVFGFAALGPATAQPAIPAAQEAPIVITRRLAPSPDVIVRVVYIADLDLKSAAGQQAMEARVSKAVDDMCAVPSPIPTYGAAMEKPCRDDAWESARPQMKRVVDRAHGL
jgi:UrcA family protein